MLLNAVARRDDMAELGTIWQEALRGFDDCTALSMSEALASMPALPDSAAKYRMFEAVAQLLEAMCDTRPLVIVIDDSHLIDDSSQELLRYVMTRLKDEPILVLLSFLPIAASHPLPSWTARIDAHARRVLELAPLPEPDMRRLSAAVTVGFESSSVTSKSAVREARGNPLTLIQLLIRYQQGPIRHDEIDVLDPTNCRSRILAFLAAAGTALSSWDLRKLCLHSDLDIDTSLRSLDEEGTIESEAGGFRICHNPQRQEILRRLSASDNVRVHAQLAAHYAACSAPPAVIARHLFDAEDYPTAVQYALTAAKEYESVLAFSEAAQILNLCLRVPGIGNVASLYVRIGNNLLKAGAIAAADEAFESLQTHVPPCAAADLLLRAKVGRILVANSRTLAYPPDDIVDLATVASNAAEAGLVAEALKVYTVITQSAYHTQNDTIMYDVMNRLEQLSVARPHDCSVQFLLASIVALRSRRKALNLSRRAFYAAKRQQPSDELIHGQRVYASSLLHNGMVHKALDVCGDALVRAEQSGGVIWLPGLLNDYGVILLEAGRTSDAMKPFDRVSEVASEGFFAERALASLNLAVLHFETGDHARVLAQIRAAIEHGLHTPLAESVGHALVGLNFLRNSDLPAAKTCYETLMRLQSSLAGPVMGDPYYIDVFRAQFLAAIGDRIESERLLEVSIRVNRRRYLLPTLRLKLEWVELFEPDNWHEVNRIQRIAKRLGAGLLASRAAAVPT
ncbi:MAG: AAA family ATPase [Candidatus Binatia bacterium]